MDIPPESLEAVRDRIRRGQSHQPVAQQTASSQPSVIQEFGVPNVPRVLPTGISRGRCLMRIQAQQNPSVFPTDSFILGGRISSRPPLVLENRARGKRRRYGSASGADHAPHIIGVDNGTRMDTLEILKGVMRRKTLP